MSGRRWILIAASVTGIAAAGGALLGLMITGAHDGVHGVGIDARPLSERMYWAAHYAVLCAVMGVIVAVPASSTYEGLYWLHSRRTGSSRRSNK